MKPRQQLICCNCNKQYSVPLPKNLPANLRVNCPYCSTECVIDFRQLNETKALFRNSDEEVTLTGQYALPDIINSINIE